MFFIFIFLLVFCLIIFVAYTLRVYKDNQTSLPLHVNIFKKQ